MAPLIHRHLHHFGDAGRDQEEEGPRETERSPIYLWKPCSSVQISSHRHRDTQRESAIEHDDVRWGKSRIADGGLVPGPVRVGEEAGHEVQDDAGRSDEAPENDDASDLFL